LSKVKKLIPSLVKQRARRARGEVGRYVIRDAADTPGLLPVGQHTEVPPSAEQKDHGKIFR